MKSVLLLALALPAVAAGLPLDCLPDRVVTRDTGADDPSTLFGATALPGIVLGPPGDSSATTGSLSVTALGWGGSITLAFDDIEIEDGPGPDLTIFENAFFVGAPPADAEADFLVFAEPATVELSADGVSWVPYPHDAAALAAVDGPVLRAEYEQLVGLAGIVPTFTGNWSVPEDRAQFTGPGGIAGAGGDALDLAAVGLASARFVRVTDADRRVGSPGPGNGFDLDAIVVHHGRPLPPIGDDSDGDGLTDLAESARYGTDPHVADSDGDGVDDGREVASCRDPLSASTTPVPPRDTRLWVEGGSCTTLRWSFLGSAARVDLIRGAIAGLATVGERVDLGPTTCLAASSAATHWSCDDTLPLPGEAWFYLAAAIDSDWGSGSEMQTREREFACP